MGCTASKPAQKPKDKQNGKRFVDTSRPPRTSSRPLHPSAHHPDALPHQQGAYLSKHTSAAPQNFRQNVPSHVAFQDTRWKTAQHSQAVRERTSRSKGGSKGWTSEGGNLKTTAKTRQKEKERLAQQKANQTLHQIPRKPVAILSVPAQGGAFKGKPKGGRPGKPSTILWQARDQSRFPPAPGPPPNRPIPLLPIAKTQPSEYGKGKGKKMMQQGKQSAGQSSSSMNAFYSVFPPRPGPPPSWPLPAVPTAPAAAAERQRRQQVSMSVLSGVSSLGPEPERFMPHLPRPPRPVNGQWARLSTIGKMGEGY